MFKLQSKFHLFPFYCFEIDNDSSIFGELETFPSFSYLNSVSNSGDPDGDAYIYDTEYSWNNRINSFIDNYFRTKFVSIATC